MEERVLTFRLHSSGQTYADALQAARYRQESSRSVGEICMRMFNHCMALSDDKSQPSCYCLPWRTLLFFTMVAAGVITRYKHKLRSRQCDMLSCFGTDVAIVCQHKVLSPEVYNSHLPHAFLPQFSSLLPPSCQRQQLHHLLESATSCIPGFCSGFILLQHLSHVQPHFA